MVVTWLSLSPPITAAYLYPVSVRRASRVCDPSVGRRAELRIELYPSMANSHFIGHKKMCIVHGLPCQCRKKRRAIVCLMCCRRDFAYKGRAAVFPYGGTPRLIRAPMARRRRGGDASLQGHCSGIDF